jgi:DNA-binding PadR family transcriptional regulator
MQKIDHIDLEFLYLAAKNNEGFDETDIARSELSALGVGRILDRLASLKERGLLKTEKEIFVITDEGKRLFWNDNVSKEIRILRLLKIKPLSEQDIARYLLDDETSIAETIDVMRANHMVMFTTIREGELIRKICQITEDGLHIVDGQPTPEIDALMSQISSKLGSSGDAQKVKIVEEKLHDILKQL